MAERPTHELTQVPGTLVGGYAPGEWRQFERHAVQELRPWGPDVDMTKISVSSVDEQAGSPKAGDWIARNPKDHDDQWLVSAKYFAENGFSDQGDAAARMERVDGSIAKQLSEALAENARLKAEIDALKAQGAAIARTLG